jgi:hypothetical protein
VSLREVVVLVPVLALLLVFGVAPSLLTDRIDPATENVLARVAPSHVVDIGAPRVQAIGEGPGLLPPAGSEESP